MVRVRVPQPRVPVQPSGTGWGTIPGLDPVTFNRTYVMTIAAGSAVSFAALFAALVVLWRDRAVTPLGRQHLRIDEGAT